MLVPTLVMAAELAFDSPLTAMLMWAYYEPCIHTSIYYTHKPASHFQEPTSLNNRQFNNIASNARDTAICEINIPR